MFGIKGGTSKKGMWWCFCVFSSGVLVGVPATRHPATFLRAIFPKTFFNRHRVQLGPQVATRTRDSFLKLSCPKEQPWALVRVLPYPPETALFTPLPMLCISSPMPRIVAHPSEPKTIKTNDNRSNLFFFTFNSLVRYGAASMPSR